MNPTATVCDALQLENDSYSCLVAKGAQAILESRQTVYVLLGLYVGKVLIQSSDGIGRAAKNAYAGYLAKRAAMPKNVFDAASIGSESLIKKYLGSGESDPVNDEGKTPLMLAIQGQHQGSVKLLLEQGANPSLVTQKSQTSLHFAIEAKHSGITKQIVEEDPSLVNAQDSEGRTPLMMACEIGTLHLVRTLLNDDCIVDLKDTRGRTALHYAAASQNPEVIQALMEKNASAEIEDGDGFRPLDVVCGAYETTFAEFERLYFSEDFLSLDEKKKLKEAYASLGPEVRKALEEKLEPFGQEVIEEIRKNPLYQPVVKRLEYGSYDDFKIPYPLGRALLEIDPRKLQIEDGNTFACAEKLKTDRSKAIFCAVAKGKCSLVLKWMEDKGFDPNGKNADELPLIHHALLHGQEEIALQLLRHKDLDRGCEDRSGNTIAHAAAKGGMPSILRQLNEKEMSVKNRAQQTPLEVAVKARKTSVYESILDKMDPKLLEKKWKKEGLTAIEYAVATSSTVLRDALAKKGVYFAYDQNPERFYPIFCQNTLEIFEMFEPVLGEITKELSELKKQLKSFIKDPKKEPTPKLDRFFLEVHHFLENAALDAKQLKQGTYDRGESTLTKLTMGTQSFLNKERFGEKRELPVQLLQKLKRQINSKFGKEALRKGLPVHPFVDGGLNLLEMGFFREITPFKLKVMGL